MANVRTALWCHGRKEGKPLAWDTTVVCTVADTYVSGSARGRHGGEDSGQCKEAKYATKPSFPASCCGVAGYCGRSDFVIFGLAGSQNLGIIWR